MFQIQEKCTDTHPNKQKVAYLSSAQHACFCLCRSFNVPTVTIQSAAVALTKLTHHTPNDASAGSGKRNQF